MSLKNNYFAWQLLFSGSDLAKKKCLRKFYDWIYVDGFCKQDFLRKRKKLKFKNLLKQLYNLYIVSDLHDKAKLELYFDIINNMFADEGDTIANGNGQTTMAKAQLLFFLKKMRFMKFKIWKKLLPELATPLRPVNKFSPWFPNKIWKPWHKEYKNKRKVNTCSYLNRFTMDKTFLAHKARLLFPEYEELEEIQEDLEEQLEIIKQVVGRSDKVEGMSNLFFYMKHKNYIDNFRSLAKDNVEILNIKELKEIK